MKKLILAAGYGTRLEEDIRSDTSGRYAGLSHLPKALLPVGGKPLLDHLLQQLGVETDDFSEVYLVTNGRYYLHFRGWAQERGFPLNHIVNDITKENDGRLGTIADLLFLIKKKKLYDNLLVTASDVLFYPDFSISDMVSAFYKCKGSLVPSYTVRDDEVSRRGIIEVDQSGRITTMLEKPSSSQTASRLAVPPLYLYHYEVIPRIVEFLTEKMERPLAERDAPGLLLQWLAQRSPMYTFPISGRFDVGTLQDYQALQASFPLTAPPRGKA